MIPYVTVIITLVILLMVWPLLIMVGPCVIVIMIFYGIFHMSSAGRNYFQSQTGEQRRSRHFPPHHPAQPFPEGTRYSHSYVTMARNESGTGFCNLFAQQWLPPADITPKPKALIFFCFGFADHANWIQKITIRRFVDAGFACFSLDNEGHGRSDGLHAHIPNFDVLVRDQASHYTKIRAQYPDLKAFVYSESMGGAIALYLATRHPELMDGVIFLAPMAKISDKLKPSQRVIDIFVMLSKWFPTLPIAPVPDVAARCFKDPAMLALAYESPIRYGLKPRLATGHEMLRVAFDIENNVLSRMRVPFLVLHGGDDTVTDPAVSRHLASVAPATDKTIHIYDGMWHALMHALPHETERVCRDVFAWLEQRV